MPKPALSLLLALAVLVSPAPGALAQGVVQQSAHTVGAARITGTVYDSVAHRPLAGAQVQIVNAETLSKQYMVTADSLGRFEFDSIPPGKYIAGFFHPAVDLLGIETPLRAITVRAGAPNLVGLATPGPAEMIASLCGKQTASDSLGAIVGRVRGADSHLPIPDASVVVSWLRVIFANGKLESTPRTEKAVTDIDGVYRMCGLPGADTLFATVDLGERHTGTISVAIPAGAVTRRDFIVGDSSSAVAVVLDSTSGEEVRRRTTVLHGSSTLTGFVRGEKNKGLADVGISVSGTGLTATTDATGHYRLAGLPAGTFAVQARAIGREPRAAVVDLSSSSPASVDFTLDKQLEVLSRVTVYGKVPKARSDIDEFLQRKASGRGHYLTASDLQHAFSVTSAVRAVPGVRVVPSGRFDQVIVMHLNKCPATVFIDGIKVNQTFESIDDIPTNQIAGIEVYTDALETPSRFASLAGCGVIAIWRKW